MVVKIGIQNFISKQENQMIKPLPVGENAISDEEIPTKSVIIKVTFI